MYRFEVTAANITVEYHYKPTAEILRHSATTVMSIVAKTAEATAAVGIFVAAGWVIVLARVEWSCRGAGRSLPPVLKG